ncbi:uncharacterized protein LOC8258587 isoform X2 [Ricinus communis]|uniref:uncharacterized protein LOC8258587 isoform X2 n=1 Tax=Ricinus communis TaxID=3988 RepID=UPI000D6933E7|nr:uncharacterized protein LOC8258587 isoform X2 [Ricinus communis]|eukprot:XP_025012603.1 uncharacterized protein LOC8258587 isoform X2 [Ricinus communis]
MRKTEKGMGDEDEEKLSKMGLGKEKEGSNLDMNFSESFSEPGFQDSGKKVMGSEFFDHLVDDRGKGSSSSSEGDVESRETRKYTNEEKAEGKIDDYDYDDDNIVDNNSNLDLNLRPDELDASYALQLLSKIMHREVTAVNQESSRYLNQETSRNINQESSRNLNQETSRNINQESSRNLNQETSRNINQESSRNLNQESYRYHKDELRSRHEYILSNVAEHFAHPGIHNEVIKRKSSEVDKELDDSQSPFSLAMELVKKRNFSQSVDNESSIKWLPAQNKGHYVSSHNVPKLMDLCLNVLATNADKIVSLENVPDDLRHRLCKMVSDRRKMDAHFVELLARDSPTEIRVWDTSQLTEDDCIKIFCACDTRNLTVLQLDLCGLCIHEHVLRRILAGPLCRLHKLATISLKGAFRLSDAGLSALAKSAPGLLSINLSQCSLLTSDAINDLAIHMKSTLRELYIDDCQNINAMLFLPALKKFKHLEVLSVAGIQTVSDDFVIGLVEACGMNMKELVLANCVELTDLSLKCVGKTCPKLCALDLSHLHNLTDSALQYLANGCRSICKIKLCRNDFRLI